MQKTKFPGVYQRESETRKHGARPDACFYVTYRNYNKKVWVKVGWQSEGYSAKLAAQTRGKDYEVTYADVALIALTTDSSKRERGPELTNGGGPL